MTFDQWWATEGARDYCETHEARARQAWDAATAKSKTRCGELREELATVQDEVLKRDARIAQLARDKYRGALLHGDEGLWLQVTQALAQARAPLVALMAALTDPEKLIYGEWGTAIVITDEELVALTGTVEPKA